MHLLQVVLCLIPLLVSSALGTGQDACAPNGLSIEQRVQRLAQAFDVNSDGKVTGAELEQVLRDDFDTDGDGAVTEAEFIAFFHCACGDTEYVARAIWVIDSEGKPTVAPDQFKVAPFTPGGLPIDEYKALCREAYESFYNKSCVDEQLTLDQQLDHYVADNDHDHNFLVTLSDFADDASKNYDTNADGRVTLAEHVTRWTCAFGVTADFARYIYDVPFGGQGKAFFTLDDFNYPPFNTTGMPLNEFRRVSREQFVAYDAYKQGLVG